MVVTDRLRLQIKTKAMLRLQIDQELEGQVFERQR
jgi:hypothetical protein